jgi:hypothetical protein
MFGSAYLLAFALLTASPADPAPAISTEFWPQLQASLRHLALEWEIYDPREDRLLRVEELAHDLPVLRKRRLDLADAPPAYDSFRFPVLALAVECLEFNRAFRRAVEKRLALETDREVQLKEVMRETDELYKIWDAVRDSRCDVYFVSVRRQALKNLRTLIGPEAYYTGQLPPHVPLWRFEEIR